ncbi:MAG: MATE family efflux transporter [Hyphomicrobiaceae bacterium TMED74]|nr:hypothetical protein [Filomicrobium sp.]RPG47346.1 MAG: MATE family efflux transporter [Hyphomicrobiaceae bacterium TMED74]
MKTKTHQSVGPSNPPPEVSSHRQEAGVLMHIAGPLIAAYLAEYAMVLTTKALVGQLGFRELAAVGLAGDLASQIQIVLLGTLSVVGVLVSQANGSGDQHGAGQAARHGIFAALLLALPATVLVWNLDWVLAGAGFEADLIDRMAPYLQPVSLSLLPMLCFFVLRMFVAALAKTAAILWITITAVVLNYLFCQGFIHGAYGFPQLGIAGAGWAKTAVAVFMSTALLIYIYVTPHLRGYGFFKGRFRLNVQLCREIVLLGLPVAGIVILEAGLFTAVSMFSGLLGPVALATYQVIIAWVAIAFKAAQGLAEAGMVRVAFSAGRSNLAQAQRSGLLTMLIGISGLVCLAIVPLSFPEALVRLFLKPEDPGFQPVLELASKVLVLAAFFQIFDGVQVMASFALRGLKDTLFPLWLAAFGYWVMGVGGGWWLAFEQGLGAEGLWWGMAMGLTVAGSLLAMRFMFLTHQPAHAS